MRTNVGFKSLAARKLEWNRDMHITGGGGGGGGGGRWGKQLPTAAIDISQHGGRRSRYKIIFDVHAIIKHPFMVLGVCIHRKSMYAFIEHCHLNYTSRLLLLDGGEENGGLMIICNS